VKGWGRWWNMDGWSRGWGDLGPLTFKSEANNRVNGFLFYFYPDIVWVEGVGVSDGERGPVGGGVDGAVRVMTQ
jgi:hypothetical protein